MRRSAQLLHGMLLSVLALGTGCGDDHRDAAPNPMAAALDRGVQEASLPSVSTGEVVQGDGWHALFDTRHGEHAAARLILVRDVAAVVFPDGPLQLIEPVIVFRYDRGVWTQHVGEGAAVLPDALANRMRARFADTSRTYAFAASQLELGAGIDAAALEARVRSSITTLAREAVRLRTVGFVSADAEP